MAPPQARRCACRLDARLLDLSTNAPLLPLPVFIRGGGDLGSGVALALRARGWPVVIVDQPLPGAMRLHVALAYAAVVGRWRVGEVEACLATDLAAMDAALAAGQVPVWTGSWRQAGQHLGMVALVDARMRGLSDPDLNPGDANMVVALGPGWRAGRHCHAVIETSRSEDLGRVVLQGQARPHTGVPGQVMGLTHERILRSSAAGPLRRVRQLGDVVQAGDVVATVSGTSVIAGISGLIRGLKLNDVPVGAGHKVGDIDPRTDRSLLAESTDKSRRVGQGVIEALDLLLAHRRPRDPNQWRNACT